MVGTKVGYSFIKSTFGVHLFFLPYLRLTLAFVSNYGLVTGAQTLFQIPSKKKKVHLGIINGKDEDSYYGQQRFARTKIDSSAYKKQSRLSRYLFGREQKS